MKTFLQFMRERYEAAGLPVPGHEGLTLDISDYLRAVVRELEERMAETAEGK